MKKAFIGFLLVAVVGVSTVFAKPVRIVFKRGATKAIVTGKLNGYKGSREFVVRLRAGQTLELSSNRSITLAVIDPSGEDAMDRDLGCNGRASIAPTVAGDYKIIVNECMKADPWKGTFRLYVSAR